MLVLGLDLETTGLDANTNEIIEIGAVIWDWDRQVPVQILSELIRSSQCVPEEIVSLTGITDQDLQRWGIPLSDGLRHLHDLAQQVEFIVAHNGVMFDRLFLERGWLLYPETRCDQPWIDTLTDLPLPAGIGTRKLTYLAAEHGFLNPYSHRAVFDVLTMLRVLSHYPAAEVLRMQSSPTTKVVAQVSYEEREQAKSEGFKWDPKQRHWYWEGKACLLENRKFPFPVLRP